MLYVWVSNILILIQNIYGLQLCKIDLHWPKIYLKISQLTSTYQQKPHKSLTPIPMQRTLHIQLIISSDSIDTTTPFSKSFLVLLFSDVHRREENHPRLMPRAGFLNSLRPASPPKQSQTSIKAGSTKKNIKLASFKGIIPLCSVFCYGTEYP